MPLKVKARLALLPLVLLGISLLTFVLIHVAPGSPEMRSGGSRGVSAESLAAFRRAYRLDEPLPARYAAWLWRSVRLDFGDSLVDGRPVRAKIAEALPATLALALLATLFAYAVAVVGGALLAARDGRPGARVAGAALYVVYGVPSAATAMLLLSWGAPYGSGGATVAGAACLALATSVRLMRHQRSALLEALRADYVRTARATGAGEWRVLFRHALPNALLPMVTLLGAELPALLSGSVIIEQVFGLRGLGALGYDAVLARDYPLLLGLTTVGALATLLGVLAADFTYGLLDPRLRERVA
jgi:peptide/nickel transport system permease protein